MPAWMQRATLLCLATCGLAVSLVAQVTVTPRTVTTNQFNITWSADPDAEAITSIEWSGLPGENLTQSFAVGSCNGGDVEFFGNSWGPPDPQTGGFVLVGSGTTNPSWTGKAFADDLAARVTIHSQSTGCPPSSAGVPVTTRYGFSDRDGSGNTFQVQRSFDFEVVPFAHNFRPYVPRFDANLPNGGGFTEVIYPIPGGTLTTVNVFACDFGCTGPVVPPGSNASPLAQPLDPRRSWFVIHDPTTGAGIVVRRHHAFAEDHDDDDGGPIAVQLWIDHDGGSASNATSFLLMNQAAGFQQRLTEVESLCFFMNPAWRAASNTLPPECKSRRSGENDEDDE